MAVDTITLVDLGPVIAAILGPMLVIMAASMRYQYVDSAKTRELIDNTNQQNRELIDNTNQQNRELIDNSNQQIRELIGQNRELIGQNRVLIEQNRELIEKSHAELRDSLAEARERLARIEGYVRIPPPSRPSPEDAEPGAEAA